MLNLKELFISESCIEIKILLNFFTLSEIGSLRVKIYIRFAFVLIIYLLFMLLIDTFHSKFVN